MCPRTMCPRAHVRTCARAHVPRAPGFGWKHNRLKSYFFSEKKPRRVFVKNLVALPFSIRERLQTRQETMAAEDGDDQRGVKPTDKKKCSKWWVFVGTNFATRRTRDPLLAGWLAGWLAGGRPPCPLTGMYAPQASPRRSHAGNCDHSY